MRYAKRISIYILVGLLSVGTTCGSYAQGVYAFEWVGGAIAFEEALKWLLGAIGICAGVGFTHDMWAEYGDDFTDYCIQHEIQQSELAVWQGKLASGVLDKASECWSAFLDWASELVGSGTPDGFYYGMSYPSFISMFNATYSLNLPVNTSYQDRIVYGFIYRPAGHNYNSVLNLVFDSSPALVINSSGSISSRYFLSYWNISSRPDQTTYQTSSFSIQSFDIISSSWLDLSSKNPTVVNYGEAITGDEYMNTLDGLKTGDLDLISSDIPDEEDTEVAIPMPGVSTSDDTASASAYDDIVDAINDGTITLDDGITRIQELLRVIVYDTTTDDVIPTVDDPDTGEPVKKDDVIKDNKNNMGFTLGGLENVFPFCIPWDLYAFINILRADPVAPVFILPFPNPSDIEHPYQIRVDLSSWDDAMSIFRLAEDFLFIIGLAILTRSLIGAGGGDG